MKRAFFESLEDKPRNTAFELAEIVDQLAFDERALLPVITQDATSKAILMFAWMNKEASGQTLATGRLTYWSRSRQQLRVKGETSGHTQTLVSLSFDCDGDAVVCGVEQSGPACHTGRADCFYMKVDLKNQRVLIDSDSP